MQLGRTLDAVLLLRAVERCPLEQTRCPFLQFCACLLHGLFERCPFEPVVERSLKVATFL